MKKIIASSLIATTVLFGNNSVDININNDTLELGTEIYLNNHYNVDNNSNYYFTASYLHTEANPDDTNSKTKSLTTFGMKVLNPYTDDNGISLGLGIKSVYTSQFDKTFIATPLSLYGRYEINEVVYLDVDLGYAPNVLSYEDASKYYDMNVKVNYKVLSDGYAYVGARNITTTYDAGNGVENEIKYDTSVFVGFKVKF